MTKDKITKYKFLIHLFGYLMNIWIVCVVSLLVLY